MKRLLLSLLLISIVIAPGVSYGAIYILVDQFSPEKKFPIAVADLLNEKTDAPDQEGKAIADILSRNLKLAGYFDLVSVPRALEFSSAVEPDTMPFDQWNSIGARVFVKGTYKKRGKKAIQKIRH